MEKEKQLKYIIYNQNGLELDRGKIFASVDKLTEDVVLQILESYDDKLYDFFKIDCIRIKNRKLAYAILRSKYQNDIFNFLIIKKT